MSFTPLGGRSTPLHASSLRRATPYTPNDPLTPSPERPVRRPCGTQRSPCGPTPRPTALLRLRPPGVPRSEWKWIGDPAARGRRDVRPPCHGGPAAARRRERPPAGVRWFAHTGHATWG